MPLHDSYIYYRPSSPQISQLRLCSADFLHSCHWWMGLFLMELPREQKAQIVLCPCYDYGPIEFLSNTIIHSCLCPLKCTIYFIMVCSKNKYKHNGIAIHANFWAPRSALLLTAQLLWCKWFQSIPSLVYSKKNSLTMLWPDPSVIIDFYINLARPWRIHILEQAQFCAFWMSEAFKLVIQGEAHCPYWCGRAPCN